MSPRGPPLSPRGLWGSMAAERGVVSGHGRHRPPSAGTAASRGAGTAGGCAGNSRAPPEPLVGLRRGLASCMGGRDGGPAPPPWWMERVRPGALGSAGSGPAVTGLRRVPRAGPAMLSSQGFTPPVPILPQQRLRESVSWAAGAAQPGRCCRGSLRAPRGGGSAGRAPSHSWGRGATCARRCRCHRGEQRDNCEGKHRFAGWGGPARFSCSAS